MAEKKRRDRKKTVKKRMILKKPAIASIQSWSGEHKFQVLFESANDIIVCVDTKGMIVDVNKKVYDVLGFKANDIKNQNIFDLPVFDRRDLPRILKMFRRIVKTGKLLTENGKAASVIQFVLKHKNGRDVYVETSTRSFLTVDRKKLFVSVVRDVTQRKIIEQSLQEVNERLEAFMASANEGFMLFDSDLNVVDINDYLLNAFGVKKEDVVGLSMYDISYDVYETGRCEIYKKVIQTGKLYSHETQVPSYLGNKLMSVKAFKVGNGMGMILRDITTERKAEKELRESEQRFRILYEAVHAGIIVHTADGRVSHINKPGCRMLGVNECTENVPLESVFKIVDKDGRSIPSVKHPSFIALRTGKAVHQAVRCVRVVGTDKLRWLIINTEPILDMETKKVEEIILTFFDISDRKNIEQALKESEERYRHMFEHCPVGVGIATLDGHVVAANRAMLDITGYTMGDFKEVNISDTYVNIEDRQALMQILEQKGSVTNFQTRLKRKDGVEYDALLSIARITIQGKEYFHTICQVVNEEPGSPQA